MGTVVIDVMLKPEILDPQGKAVAGALPRLGFERFTDVRQGKRFELVVEGEVTEEVLDEAREAARVLLSNPVIEDAVSVRAEQDVGSVRAERDVGSVRAEQDSEAARAEHEPLDLSRVESGPVREGPLAESPRAAGESR